MDAVQPFQTEEKKKDIFYLLSYAFIFILLQFRLNQLRLSRVFLLS